MKLWEDFLAKQDEVLGKKNVDLWLRSLRVIRFDARNIYLEAKDAFHANWFKEHITDQAKRLTTPSGKPLRLHVNVAATTPKKKPIRKDYVFHPDPLIKVHTFSSFHVSKENALVYELLQNIHSLSFNPVFLYGPRGCGKTHLLMSLAKKLSSLSLQTFYIKAETFTSHVVGAIQFGTMQNFRQTYRSVDVLILDNIHVLAGKNATQEELFHTFNELHTQGKKIVIGSSYAPQEFKGIEPRLISRFEWGISLPIETPRKEDIEKVLQKKAKALHFPITKKQLRFCLQSFRSLDAIYKAFDALVIRNPSKDTPLEIALQDLLQEEIKKTITLEAILEEVVKEWDVSSGAITGKSQEKEISYARKVAMYLCRKELYMPFTSIGRAFNRDHSTVMSAVKFIEKSPPSVVQKIQIKLRKPD